jgi:hypothetical protein
MFKEKNSLCGSFCGTQGVLKPKFANPQKKRRKSELNSFCFFLVLVRDGRMVEPLRHLLGGIGHTPFEGFRPDQKGLSLCGAFPPPR